MRGRDGEGGCKENVFQRVTMRIGGCWRWSQNMQISGKEGVECWRWYVDVQTSGVGIV